MPKSKDDLKRRYVVEQQARDAILDRLGDRFEFLQQISAVNRDGDRFYIDAVGICKTNDWIFGWEFKKSHLFKSEFSNALRQAIHYRHSRITDNRLPDMNGKQLPAVVLFPDWLGEHDDDASDYSREAEGMRLLAAQFRVGTVRERNHGQFSFFMGQSGIWHSPTGWTQNAEGVLFGKRGLGSVRKRDV